MTSCSEKSLRVYWRIFVKFFVAATEFCLRNKSHRFSLIWYFATCCGDKILLRSQSFLQKFSRTHEAICRCDVSPHRVAATSRGTCTHEATWTWSDLSPRPTLRIKHPAKGPSVTKHCRKKVTSVDTKKKHLELFTSRRHFGEIKQPKTLNQPQGRATALASESKSCGSQKINMRVTTLLIKRPKFTFPQSKRFPPKHDLRGRENNSLEQAAFWHAIKVVCGLPIPLFYRGEITMTVARSTELEELFAWTNIWWIRLLPNPVGRTQKTFFFPEQATPKVPSAPILKQISILGRANPGDQHPSFYSEIFRNLFITVLNIANDLLETLLDSLLTACIEIKPMGIVPVSLSVFTPVPNILTARVRKNTDCFAV